MVDPAGGMHGGLHAAAGRHDRHGGSAGHSERAARQLHRRAVGPGRVRPDAGLAAADLRGAGRPVRPEAVVQHRVGHLHDRLAAVRGGPGPADADRVEERPGRGRRDHVRHVAGAAREQLPGSRPRRGVRGVGAVMGISTALGPVLGGVITTDWSWRGIFLVNVPIGVVAVALTAWKVDESKSPHPTPPDWAGFALLTTGLVSLIYGLIRAGENSWSDTGVLA